MKKRASISVFEQVATVTGWGSTAYGGSPSSTLQEVNVTVISNDECSSAYGDRIKKYEKSIVYVECRLKGV